MHCFASENQTYTGLVIFGVEYPVKVFKRSRKPTAEKSRLEKVRFLSWRTFFVGKNGIQVPTKWLLKGL